MTTYSVAKLRRIKDKGRFNVAPGLFLLVGETGSKSWVQRIRINGKRTDKGLGSFGAVSLTEAMNQAEANRVAVRSGRNPWANTIADELPAAGRWRPSFGEVIEDIYRQDVKKYGDAAHLGKRKELVMKYTKPIWSTNVTEITSDDVLAVLEPIWFDKNPTARRVRQKMDRVFKRVAFQYKSPNPMEGFDGVMPTVRRNEEHRKALHHSDVPAALAKIRAARFYPTMAWPVTTLCFEFLVLTAARSGEARGARWSEIDLGAKLWTIPAERMKMSRPHRVPLSRQAIFLLTHNRDYLGEDDLVFAGPKGKPLSENTLTMRACKDGLIPNDSEQRACVIYPKPKDGSEKKKDVHVHAVPHGFRSSFRNWVAETQHNASWAAAELCLAHRPGSAVETAYLRTDLLDQRRELMQAWGDHCDPPLF